MTYHDMLCAVPRWLRMIPWPFEALILSLSTSHQAERCQPPGENSCNNGIQVQPFVRIDHTRLLVFSISILAA